MPNEKACCQQGKAEGEDQHQGHPLKATNTLACAAHTHTHKYPHTYMHACTKNFFKFRYHGYLRLTALPSRASITTSLYSFVTPNAMLIRVKREQWARALT